MSFNTAAPRAEYQASAGQTLFPFVFKIYNDTDLKVYKTLANVAPNETDDLLILDIDYTVSIDGDVGGSITLPSGASINDAITLLRDLPTTREIEYQTSGDLLAKTLNDDQEYQTYLLADNKQVSNRTLVFEENLQGMDNKLPTPEALKPFRWDSEGKGIENYTPTSYGEDSVQLNIFNVDHIAEMLTIDHSIYPTVNVRGHHSANDGGGGLFNYDSTIDKSTANGGTIFDPNETLANQGTGVGAGCWVRQYSGAVNVKWFGAKGDSSTDDIVAIQAAIDYVSSIGGGTVLFPTSGQYRTSSEIILKDDVKLKGENPYRAYQSDSPSVINCQHPGIGIKYSGIRHVGVERLTVQGGATLSVGIQIEDGQCEILNVGVNTTQNQGILLLSSTIACVVKDIIAVNTLLNRANFTEYKGSVDITGTDHFLNRIEANAESGFFNTVTTGNAVALYIRGANHFVTDCIGEFGEVGIYSGAVRSRFVDCRADLCMGDGWVISGSSSQYTGCVSMNCGTAADSTYKGFYVVGALNTFTACGVSKQGTAILDVGIQDTISSSSEYNTWIVPYCEDNAADTKFTNNDFLGSSFIFNTHFTRITTGTTPSAAGVSALNLAYASSETIIDFIGGVNTQQLSIQATSTVTIQNGLNIKTSTGLDKILSSDRIYTFMNYNGIWYETGDGTKYTKDFDSSNLLNLGGFYLWVDTSSKLRINYGIPISDTDGTVVGAQTA